MVIDTQIRPSYDYPSLQPPQLSIDSLGIGHHLLGLKAFDQEANIIVDSLHTVLTGNSCVCVKLTHETRELAQLPT